MAQGALNYARFPGVGDMGAFSQFGQQMPMDQVLDNATNRLMDAIGSPGYPMRAASAAVGEAGAVPAPVAIGAGIQAFDEARINQALLPLQARRLGAQASLEQAQAEQAQLANMINRMNLSYYTQPWTEQGDMAGGAGNDAIASITGDSSTPLTDESRQQLGMLQQYLNRAIKFSTHSPQARQDIPELMATMSQIIREDPLAKEHFATLGKRDEARIDLDKTIRGKINDIGQQSLDAAQAEFAKISPEGMQVDPNIAASWIKARTKQIMNERIAAYGETLKAQHIDPTPYIGGSEGAAPAQAGQVDPNAAAELQSEVAQEQTPAMLGKAPPSGVAPIAAPQAPPTTGGLPELNPQPTSRNVTRIQQEQGKAQSNITTLETTLRDLEAALGYNDRAIYGPGAEDKKALLAVKDYVFNKARNLVGMKDETSDTLYATERLDSILKSSLLGRLNQAGPDDELSLGGIAHDNQLQELMSSPLSMDPAVRKTLILRAIRLIAPRLKFEQARLGALMKGKIVQNTDYPDWLKQSMPLNRAESILAGTPEEE